MKIIKVTQEHIDKGRRDNCTKCALALALQDEMGRAYEEIAVGAMHIFLYKAHHKPADKYLLTDDMRTFIRNFDRNIPVEPFEFDFDSLECVRQT